MAVHIRGATGEFASRINGKFNPLLELDENGKPVLCDGKPIYLKADGTDVCIEYNFVSGGWQVKPGHSRGKCVAWASISSAGSIESCSTGIWLVWNSQFKRFSQQPDIVILAASPPIQLEGATQEPSQTGKKKRTDDAEYVPLLDGIFDATELLHDRRPVYQRRRSAPTKDLCEADWIEYCAAKGEWQIKRASHRSTGLGFACVSWSGNLEMCEETNWRVWTGSQYQQQHIVVRAIEVAPTKGPIHANPSASHESTVFSSLGGLLPTGFLNFFGLSQQDANTDANDDTDASPPPAPAEDSKSSFELESLLLCNRR
jgi:hypothetical protein